MVKDLLAFAQTMLVRRIPLQVQALNLGAICSDVVNALVASHPGRAISLHHEGNLFGFWDAIRVGQLLTNLASNAIHHGATQGPVTVSVTGEDDSVVMKVHNEGAPIPQSARASLFEPGVATSFHRKAVPDGVSGLGLGLYIAREIVVAHKGELEMESTESEGTTFTVRLPR